MRFHVNGYHLKQYMTESNGWTNVVWNEVDFVVFGSHFRRLQPSRQAFQMKIVHNQLPTVQGIGNSDKHPSKTKHCVYVHAANQVPKQWNICSHILAIRDGLPRSLR